MNHFTRFVEFHAGWIEYSALSLLLTLRLNMGQDSIGFLQTLVLIGSRDQIRCHCALCLDSMFHSQGWVLFGQIAELAKVKGEVCQVPPCFWKTDIDCNLCSRPPLQ